jgi:rSAM/selenodomain-associated transferase 1
MGHVTRTDDGLCAIAVMAKTPEVGRSKTRLCPPLRPEQAATLSAAFLRDTTENLRDAARDAPIARYAAYAPIGTEHSLREHLAPGTRLIPADGSIPPTPGVEGFGSCLLHAIRGMLAEGHEAACVLSSDIPTLPTDYLVQAALASLAPPRTAAGRIVLGACDDGGYYLLGMTAPHASLFADIAWSTARVAEATRARARALGLELFELEPWYDVDDADGLATLLEERAGYAAPSTAAAIERLRLRAALAPS